MLPSSLHINTYLYARAVKQLTVCVCLVMYVWFDNVPLSIFISGSKVRETFYWAFTRSFAFVFILKLYKITFSIFIFNKFEFFLTNIILLWTHPLILSSVTVVFPVTDPFLGNAGATGASEGIGAAFRSVPAVLFIRLVATIVVLVALEAVLDATSIATGELIRATRSICAKFNPMISLILRRFVCGGDFD